MLATLTLSCSCSVPRDFLARREIISNIFLRHSLSSSFSTRLPRELSMMSGATSFTLTNSARTPTWLLLYAQRSGRFGLFAVVAVGSAPCCRSKATPARFPAEAKLCSKVLPQTDSLLTLAGGMLERSFLNSSLGFQS